MKFRRNTDNLQYALKHFPCVALLGARQVGKTTLSKNLLPKAEYYDLEDESSAQLISKDIIFFLNQITSPVIFDEAQLLPDLFKALRANIDKNRNKPGQFIITGSSSPELLNNISESLAGRIAIFEIDPLAINEIKNIKPSGFYKHLLNSSHPKKEKFEDSTSLALDMIFFGGYPEIQLKKNDRFKSVWFDNYIKTYIDRDIRRLFPDLQIETYKRFIKMLAISSAEQINQHNYAASLGVSSPTVKNYLQIAEGTFIFRELLAFSRDSNTRLVKTSKGFIRDTGLLSFMYGIESSKKLYEHPKLGALFEIFVIEQILKGLRAQGKVFNFSYFRTSNQVEVDLVIEIQGNLIPIEIKFGSTFRSEHLKGLEFFMKKYKSKIGFIINNSSEVIELAPNIFQIPFSFL